MEQQPLSSSHEAYFNAFQAFVSKSAWWETVKKYSCEAVAHIMQKLTVNAVNSQVFRILGVGSGNGKLDIEILKAVTTSLRASDKAKKALIHACIVEPSSFLIADFKKAVSPLPECVANVADVSFEWQETDFEDFITNSSPHESNHYHMAHFIGCLYYMDAEQSLNNGLKLLANGGALLCLVAGDNSYFAKQSLKFQDKLKCLPAVSKFYTGKDLVAIAERNNWKYEEFPLVQYEVDITSCFDRSSPTGRLLLNFLTHEVDFQGSTDPMLYKEVMEFLTESSISDSNGRKLLTSELAIVVLYK
ncbi:hypothetical protein OS493_019184 [Desmophyllum pertusum]|uniref:Uncharacterized protein n=1 Tax=Desmophyllum pertusum TaxID=174260 RepID=A0A9X0CE21_9CNID|nr:hypothetical protein OS493_019184 [Desmophyllum pertusum]